MLSERAIIMSLLSVSSTVVPKEYILDNRINKGYKILYYTTLERAVPLKCCIGLTQEDDKKMKRHFFLFFYFLHSHHAQRKKFLTEIISTQRMRHNSEM